MNDWYNNYLNDKMEKEASAKEGIMISLISLLSSVGVWFEADYLKTFLESKNVPHEQFVETINNINHTVKNIQEIDKSDIIEAKEHLNEYMGEDTREDLTPEEVIARTIYDEARGEGLEGMKAVAAVILNRSDGTPESMKEICLKPFQFSGWNNEKMVKGGSGEIWEASKGLANQILNPQTKPDKSGNTLFCNPSTILSQKNINIPPVEKIEDLTSISEAYMKYLPSFMFNSEKVDLGKGRWKNIYPKRTNNLRDDFTVVNNHLFYQ